MEGRAAAQSAATLDESGGQIKMATPFQKQPIRESNYTTTSNNYIHDFHQAIISLGLTPPDRIIDDGVMHRFSSNGKRSDDAGWYVLYGDGVPAGSFGCWRLGLNRVWCSKQAHEMTASERVSHQRRIEEMKADREAERLFRNVEASVKAEEIWSRSKPADADHPYLQKKCVQPYDLRQTGDALLVPLHNKGQIASLQFIHPDGSKRFLTGGKIKGSYSPIGVPQDGARIYICEGWATGATIHQHTEGAAVLCAMNANNLAEFGRYASERWPNTEIIIAGDDDRLTKGNPGRTAAMRVATELKCKIMFPPFPADAPMELSDFNDWVIWGASR